MTNLKVKVIKINLNSNLNKIICSFVGNQDIEYEKIYMNIYYKCSKFLISHRNDFFLKNYKETNFTRGDNILK